MATGRCYCGEVQYEVSSEKVMFSAFCHCKECRRAHACAVYSVSVVPVSNFTVTKGEDHVKDFFPKPKWDPEGKMMSRCFCSNCGSRVFNKFIISEDAPAMMPPGEYRGFFHGSLDCAEIPEPFKPTQHFWCSEAIAPLPDDGLPKLPTFTKASVLVRGVPQTLPQ